MIREQNIPQVISVSEMSRLMEISRSRLYQLIDLGVILPPAYLLSNHRPIYVEEMAKRNLEVKQQNTGINGQIVVFYASRGGMPKPCKSQPKKRYDTPKPPPQGQELHQDLLEVLESLGMTGITTAQITQAMAACFPAGINNIAQEELIRSVFLYLKQQK